MKKLIAILTIAIVLVGAVFAAETHQLQITTTVGEYQPIFQLVYDTTKTNTTRQSLTPAQPTRDDNADGNDFRDGQTYTINSVIDASGTDITTTDFSDSVTARLGAKVKLAASATYTLTFRANPLVGETTGHEILPIAKQNTLRH